MAASSTVALDRLVLSRRQIATCVADLASMIDSMFDVEVHIRHEPLMLIGILKAALYFTADLSRELIVPHQVDFISYRSYKGTEREVGPGEFRSTFPDVGGKHVILVDTICDTGGTFREVSEALAVGQPRSLSTCCLIIRAIPPNGAPRVPPSFVGHVFVGEEFLVGYGLDDNDAARHLPFIQTLGGESDGS